MVRSFVDRILRLKEEVADLNRDIREVYAEAKGNGFDKTALGQLVTYVGKRQAGAAELQEREALFDLYLAAYDGSPSRTHAYARHEPQPEQNSRAVPPRTGAAVGNEAVAPAATQAPDGCTPAPEAEVGKPEAASGVQTTRVMTMTPLEKREVNGLKGFGFSVKWDDKPLRPNCQHPDHCASPGGNKHCWSCTKAASLTGENAA
jgi:uncharacterized protein (UPF0335 family)